MKRIRQQSSMTISDLGGIQIVTTLKVNILSNDQEDQ